MYKLDGSMAVATMKFSYCHSIICVHLRECRKKIFMSAFEVGRAPTRRPTFRRLDLLTSLPLRGQRCAGEVRQYH